MPASARAALLPPLAQISFFLQRLPSSRAHEPPLRCHQPAAALSIVHACPPPVLAVSPALLAGPLAGLSPSIHSVLVRPGAGADGRGLTTPRLPLESGSSSRRERGARPRSTSGERLRAAAGSLFGEHKAGIGKYSSWLSDYVSLN